MNLKSLIIPVMKRIIIISGIILMPAWLLHADPVWAHTALVKSEPPKRAALSVPPTQVQLWFNEEIEGNYASISVLSADKKPIISANAEPVPDDLRSVVLPLPEMKAGRYTVEFRVLSMDGHVVESAYDFSVKN
ncbi:hypothetical protein SAMN05216419_10684 [Nitrosomonas cryotolerans]|uniref:CopC domain-containing protein n=1 Tax=Nitrosomonas cryotolerans ATCC 49181 TaxID=1131553 RepID=A0A1N6H0K7_9PROT|nr:copper resistance CopC family protein [Nitrosomonas cryotolerans]SFQ12404.1 hypothetical protein SAMN05216419_10684 [Nitrosomonas cryotolerans]SIO13330.1 hypothetical protein SAMN02743940_0960 [Nitrosomonas cryotolerans ATCC 49181]